MSSIMEPPQHIGWFGRVTVAHPRQRRALFIGPPPHTGSITRPRDGPSYTMEQPHRTVLFAQRTAHLPRDGDLRPGAAAPRPLRRHR